MVRPMDQQNDRSPDVLALYAWLSRDRDGIEGIIAVPDSTGNLLPLVMTSKERALRYRNKAQWSADARCFPARLVTFTMGETITSVEPR